MATPTVYNFKTLASGTLASSKATLYTVPASSEVGVTTVTFFNSHASHTNTVFFYLNPTGASSVQMWEIALGPKERIEVDDLGQLTPAGALIEGSATNASEVTYFIGGSVAS